MEFTEHSEMEGIQREVTWTTTYAGSDGVGRMRVSFIGSATVHGNVKRELRTSFTVGVGANTFITVKQILSFSGKGMSTERKKVVALSYKQQMEQSLKQL